jgi:hypothetical protein
MTIDQLTQRLEEYRDLIGGDAEVRLMTQQNWPFENSITGLCYVEQDRVLYIVEGQQLGYGTKRAWEIAG